MTKWLNVASKKHLFKVIIVAIDSKYFKLFHFCKLSQNNFLPMSETTSAEKF